MSNSQKPVREIIDAYSPIVRGKKGLLGLALKAVAKPLEAAQNMLGAISRFPIGFGFENEAGQILTDCPAIIPATFHRMEKKLRASFNIAARPDASPIERESFIALAGNVQADGDILSKYCTILRTEFDSQTEKYRFIVMKEPLDGRNFRMTTLADGVAAVKQLLGGRGAEEAAKAAANPVTIRRKPIDLGKPGQLPGV